MTMATLSSTWNYLTIALAIFAVLTSGIGNGPFGANAADADPLQDFWWQTYKRRLNITGYPCKSPELVTTEDFAFAGLSKTPNLTGNPFNGTATFGAVRWWPALNTLGLSVVRLDIDPGGIIMPHTHSLATEILFCLEGEIYTGFVTKSDNPTHPNKLYAKIVKKGEAFIFPRGLLHFQLNKGTAPAVSLNVLNGQKPGFQLMPVALSYLELESILNFWQNHSSCLSSRFPVLEVYHPNMLTSSNTEASLSPSSYIHWDIHRSQGCRGPF